MSQLLLAVDTSGKNGSLALARIEPGNSEIRVLETVPLAGGAFSAQLVPQIAALLEKHEHSKRELGAFAVANGPGSFTGLRVGLAAMKALAEALQKPLVAISLLEAVARGGAEQGRVLAAMDAGRTDVYVGDYELQPEVPRNARMHSERLLSREEFLAEARNAAAAGSEVVTTDSGLAEAGRAGGIKIQQIAYPDSAMIARIGWEHLERGQTILPEDLEANYMRHSDAEIFSKPPR
jgi:tRNA threonylcarbamoyladenosine biosynthesis protein TsaB